MADEVRITSATIDNAAVARLGMTSAEIRDACLKLGKQIATEYNASAPGSLAGAASASYGTKGARVQVDHELAAIDEFGAPGHLHYGRGIAPLPANWRLRDIAMRTQGGGV